MWPPPALLRGFFLFKFFCPWKRLQKKRITSKLTRVMAFFPGKTIVVLEISFFINISWWPILLDFPKQIGTKERAAYRTCVQVPRQHRKLLTFSDMFKVGILWWFPSKSTESQNVSEGVFFGGTPRAVSQLLQRADVRLAQNDVIFSRGTVARTCHLAAILKVCLKGGGWNITERPQNHDLFNFFREIFKSDLWRCIFSHTKYEKS